MELKDYRQGGLAPNLAYYMWIETLKKNGLTQKDCGSVLTFAAGWNAAMNQIEKMKKEGK